MAKAIQEKEMLMTLLIGRWEHVSRKIADLAAALPAEKLEAQLVPDSRTPGAVIRHVAFWNGYLADSLLGKEPNGDANELPLSEYSTQASMLEALKQSSDEVAALLREASMNFKTAELVTSFIEHTSEHYGQLAVYARLTGVVPPASRT